MTPREAMASLRADPNDRDAFMAAVPKANQALTEPVAVPQQKWPEGLARVVRKR